MASSKNLAGRIRTRRASLPAAFSSVLESYDFPTVNDGVIGMAFIETVVESAKQGGVWTKMKGV
jgi:hypothetical protein